MICPLSPAHLTGLAAFQLFALLLWLCPVLAPVPLVLFVLLCLLAPLFPGFSFFLPIIARGRRAGNRVALTFDDGPDPEVTPRVLELLARHQAPATFFLVAAKAERHPGLVQAILDGGHTLGNHSYSHFPFLMLKGRAALRREIEQAQAVFRTFGVVPLAIRVWKPEIEPHAMMIKPNGNTLPATTNPEPSMNWLTGLTTGITASESRAARLRPRKNVTSGFTPRVITEVSASGV